MVPLRSSPVWLPDSSSLPFKCIVHYLNPFGRKQHTPVCNLFLQSDCERPTLICIAVTNVTAIPHSHGTLQGAAIYINIAAPCTTEIHIENQHLTLLVKPRVQPRFLHHLLILCFSCNPVIPKNKKSPKHFPFSVKIPIFASVPRAERSNAAKPAQLPNRYRLPNFLLFKSYLPTDYKKTIVFDKKL